jgi:hypothetical protein
MKRTIPQILCTSAGLVLVVTFFLSSPQAQSWQEQASIWFNILAAVAMVLGAANLVRVHLQKISDRKSGWGYSGVTLVAFFVMLSVGLFKIGVPASPQYPAFPWSGQFDQEGSPFWWCYEYMFRPLLATIFSLLAFYVATAAFRAFRAKNTEATLLLGTAFIVLLAQTYAGTLLTDWVPLEWQGMPTGDLRLENVKVTIMKVFATAGNRAIMIGIALGIVATSLKLLLGMDRSYLGRD